MPNLSDSIDSFVTGNDLEVRRTITDIPAGQTLTQAWLTIKSKHTDIDADAILQKVITSTNVAGTGHIEDTGADGTGVVRFDLTSSNTALLDGGILYVFDIKVKTSANKFFTPVLGTIKGEGQITRATA